VADVTSASWQAAPVIEVLDRPSGVFFGAALSWKRYRRWTGIGPSGVCELCGARFTEGGVPGLNSGYSVLGGGPAGQDDYRWICAVCHDLWRGQFGWTVVDTRGWACEPPGLLEAAFGLLAPPAPPETGHLTDNAPGTNAPGTNAPSTNAPGTNDAAALTPAPLSSSR
jgi:hypothetical protein